MALPSLHGRSLEITLKVISSNNNHSTSQYSVQYLGSIHHIPIRVEVRIFIQTLYRKVETGCKIIEFESLMMICTVRETKF